MSLGKARTRIKAGVKQLTSPEGLKRTVVHLGIGAALGALLDIILTYIMINFVYKYLKENAEDPATWVKPSIEGFSIFPDQQVTYYDEVLLIVITVIMVMSKKFWIVIGFFLGWYFSRYLGLYAVLDLPTPEELKGD